jgi:hypothetical protein
VGPQHLRRRIAGRQDHRYHGLRQGVGGVLLSVCLVDKYPVQEAAAERLAACTLIDS